MSTAITREHDVLPAQRAQAPVALLHVIGVLLPGLRSQEAREGKPPLRK